MYPPLVLELVQSTVLELVQSTALELVQSGARIGLTVTPVGLDLPDRICVEQAYLL